MGRAGQVLEQVCRGRLCPSGHCRDQMLQAKAERTEKEVISSRYSNIAPIPKGIIRSKVSYAEIIVNLEAFTLLIVTFSVSPFIVKLETWLRMNEIKYQVNIKTLTIYIQMLYITLLYLRTNLVEHLGRKENYLILLIMAKMYVIVISLLSICQRN